MICRRNENLFTSFLFSNNEGSPEKYFSSKHARSQQLPLFNGGPAQSRTGNTGFGGPDYIHLTTEPIVTTKYESVRIYKQQPKRATNYESILIYEQQPQMYEVRIGTNLRMKAIEEFMDGSYFGDAKLNYSMIRATNYKSKANLPIAANDLRSTNQYEFTNSSQ